MIVSVTVLGSRDGNAAKAVAGVVNYLDGRSPAPAGRSPEWWEGKQELSSKAPCKHGLGGATDRALGYYADSVRVDHATVVAEALAPTAHCPRPADQPAA